MTGTNVCHVVKDVAFHNDSITNQQFYYTSVGIQYQYSLYNLQCALLLACLLAARKGRYNRSRRWWLPHLRKWKYTWLRYDIT